MEAKPRRWRVLGLYTTWSILLGAAWCPFSTIPTEASDYYDVGETAINLFELSFMIMYILTAVPSSWFLNHSFYWSIMTGNLVLALGAGVRSLAGHSYPWALSGQFIIASGFCISMSSVSTIGDLWFEESELMIVTAIACLSNGIGVGVQMILSPAIGNIPITLGIVAILSGLQMGFMALFFERDPTHLPTSASKEDVIMFFKNWDVMRFLLFSGSALGTVSAFEGLIYEVLEPSGFSSIQVGIIGLVLMFSGLFGGLCAVLILHKFQDYSRALQIYLAIGVFGSIGMCAAVLTFPSMVCIVPIYGFGILGFIPLAVRDAVEELPDIDPSIPANVIFFTQQIFSLLYSYPALYFQVLTGLSGLYLLALFTTISIVPFLVLYKADVSSEGASIPLLLRRKTTESEQLK